MTAKRDEFDELMDTAQRSHSRSCETCKLPEVAEIVGRWYLRREEGSTVLTMQRLHAKLVERRGYPWTVSALQNHIDRCIRAKDG